MEKNYIIWFVLFLFVIFIVCSFQNERFTEAEPVFQNIKFSKNWTAYPDDKTDASEIANDTNVFKQLMIVGNKSAGGPRTVGVWDKLNVNGELCLNKVCVGKNDFKKLVWEEPLSGYLVGTNDIRNYSNTTPENCQMTCKLEPECHGWTYNNDSKKCWLKNKDIPRKIHGGKPWISGYYVPTNRQ
jgi:hypothetical protein